MWINLLNFRKTDSSLFLGKVVCFLQPLRTEGTCNMTNMTRNAYYRCFSFTFFEGKACFGLAKYVGV